MKSVLVIGGGAAGIAAALKAADSGHKVVLAESLPRLGGRLGSFTDPDTGYTFDYGEHLLLKSYKNTLELLERLNCRKQVSFQRKFDIPFHHPEMGSFRFKTSFLEVPLSLVTALLGHKFLLFKDRMKLVKRLKKLIETPNLLPLTAGEFLADTSTEEMEFFWKPLILATMNCLPDDADIRLVRTIFREGFLQKGGLGFFEIPLSEIFDRRAASMMAETGIDIKLKTTIIKIMVDTDKITTFTSQGEEINSDCVIFTVPPDKMMRIIDNDPAKIGLNKIAAKFSYSDICNLHLLFERKIFETRLGCLLGTLPQWFFRNRYITENGVGYSLTISASDRFLNYDEDIQAICLNDLSELGADVEGNKVLFSKMVLSKKATIVLDPETNDWRIGTDTRYDNVLFAGDWTDTGLPATIESAVRSGFLAAERI